MIFTDPIDSNFEDESNLIFIQEKGFYDFENKQEDHKYLEQLLLGKDYLLIKKKKKTKKKINLN